MKQLHKTGLIICFILIGFGCNDKRVLEPTIAPTGTPKKIGDSYGGGTVVYVDATGQHGLIAALNDLTVSGNSMGISDLSTTTSNIVVSGVSGNANVNISSVCININHSFDADLDISLKAPNGTIIDLSSDNGSSGDNYTNTCFVNSGPSVTFGSAPFSGSYMPEQPFTNFGASTCNGTWTLYVYDDTNGDTGTLLSWSISFISTGTTFSYPTFTPVTWWNGANINTGATATSINSGNNNTNLIVGNQGLGSYAAILCEQLTLNGYSDWYLPSKDELNQLYINRSYLNSLYPGGYWSSSEASSTAAQAQDIGGAGGAQWAISKSFPGYVRAVRSF